MIGIKQLHHWIPTQLSKYWMVARAVWFLRFNMWWWGCRRTLLRSPIPGLFNASRLQWLYIKLNSSGMPGNNRMKRSNWREQKYRQRVIIITTEMKEQLMNDVLIKTVCNFVLSKNLIFPTLLLKNILFIHCNNGKEKDGYLCVCVC